ncbi:MarR family winged helix-turn-helix transcriptional regulator [Alkaliphilus hydrothermalis]|uniref:DNA-binding MarR family transcriptional regulator n=1 Tax=Alkaliphilus hydrothermalis TaxID=1482730 RepID=A0ABS2NRH3_9FIRM|nr:MarR family transcriptional regulator [Alkaliphilus hydrothermalis]MBM7615526.1 DNA-binding MarR family transcriptional regulator [Alkaliphilus hydrothermalis]
MKDKYIVYFISKTKKKMTDFIERRLKEKEMGDLAPSYGNILTALYDNNGKLSMKEIGQLIGKDKSTITALVNKLSKLGYVKTEKSKEDRRVTYVKTTEKGREVEDKFNDISKEVYLTAYKNFSIEEREVLLKLLKKLNNNFDLE